MQKQYINADEVLRDLKPILNSCAVANNKIDGVAFVLNTNILTNSDEKGFSGPFNSKVVASLLGNFIETTQDTLVSNLQYASLMTKEEETGDLYAWTLAFPYLNYRLVFMGKLGRESHLQIHQGTVPEYVKEILPFIEEYHRLSSSD